MALDEYIYGKIATFFKKRKKASVESDARTVKLTDINARLSIFARAITGSPIDIYPATREGGYKNNSFFLPQIYSELDTYDDNLSFYLFRVLYLSVQKNLDINWKDQGERSLEESQQKALESSAKILKELFEEFPITEK
ncbi:MAG: NorD protein, partial [Flavobacteriia bacterium]